MISTYTTLVLVCYLPLISTTLIASYQNARFNPFDNHSIIYNFSSIQSQQICICQCLMNSMCKTATYNGYYQYCVLYFAYIQEGQLQLMTIDVNSSVISLINMLFTGPTATGAISSQSSTQAAIQTSPSSTMSTMITTAVATCTTLVTFDDISNPSTVPNIIPDGYKNLNWINAQYINATSMPSNSGYRYGVRSPPFVMHNPTSDNVTITTANGTRFSFDSLFHLDIE